MGESRCKGEELNITEPCGKLKQTAEPIIQDSCIDKHSYAKQCLVCIQKLGMLQLAITKG
jgi:hypothetical protein